MKTGSRFIALIIAIVITCGLSVRPAQAGYIVTLQQKPSGVVATGSGTIDLTGLTPLFPANQNGPFIAPFGATIVTGTTGIAICDFYTGFSGPTDFGGGSKTLANSGSGDRVGISGLDNEIAVPTGYVSGNALTSGSTWSGATFSSLGVTPGTYVWTWGTGVHLDSFTLVVPDSGSTLGLLVLALGALFGASRLRSIRLA